MTDEQTVRLGAGEVDTEPTDAGPEPADAQNQSAALVDPPTIPVVPVPRPASAAVMPLIPPQSGEPDMPRTMSPAVAPASAQPTRWGRIDADGNVYLKIADGERAVGCWQAGTPEEGMAHYARRFDDLLTESDLLRARLTNSGADPKQTRNSARQLRVRLADAAVVGDMAGLTARVEQLVADADRAVAVARSARDSQRAAAVARREALVGEAEQLAGEATQWKQAGDRLKEILDEWRTVRGVDRKTDEHLWKRFSKARDTFNRRRGTHFAELDRQRGQVKRCKEELIATAEALVESSEWGPTASRFRELMTEWKAAGRTHKDVDDALWRRFKAAQDAFFARRSAVLSERDAGFAANAAAKDALLAEAERIDAADPDTASHQLRRIQDRWQAIGKVPRDRIRELDERFHAVETKVHEATERRTRRADPEVDARVAQFRDRVTQYEAQAKKALAAGDTRRAEQAEAQAVQWREWLATAEKAVQSR